jgi:hypothetical protein
MNNFNKKNLFWLIPFLVCFIFFININTTKAACSDGKESVKYNDPQLKNFCGGINMCLNFCRDKNTGNITFDLVMPDSPVSMMTITGATCNNGICSGGKISETNVQPGVVTQVEYNASGTPTNIRQETVGSESFITDIAAKVVATAVFVISFIISIIGGLFINLEAWFVEIVLAINDQILKSEFVQVGYQISLAVANLIFVAGLIVVAIATILGSKSYSMKQILWKLILMTVLVNFGLSIAGTLIQISTDFSWYFLDAVNPGGGPGESQYVRFAGAIAGAFTPQRFFITNITEQGGAQTASNKNVAGPITQQDQKQIAGLFGGSLAKILTPIVSIFFTIAFLTIIVITLGALVVMLIIRYVTISLLLILLPLAWALWIFPNIGSMAGLNPFREWWNRFIRWTFFAPIVLFFLYLCLLTLRATPGGGGGLWSTETKIQNVTFTFNRTGPLGGLEAFGGSFLMNLLVPILNAVVMTGCVMGGLMVANKLSIIGAKKAEDFAYGTAKSIGMFAWNRTRGLGAAGLNKLLPKTPPPPDKKPLVRALHTVGFKAGQLAERFGVREKTE